MGTVYRVDFDMFTCKVNQVLGRGIEHSSSQEFHKEVAPLYRSMRPFSKVTNANGG